MFSGGFASRRKRKEPGGCEASGPRGEGAPRPEAAGAKAGHTGPAGRETRGRRESGRGPGWGWEASGQEAERVRGERGAMDSTGLVDGQRLNDLYQVNTDAAWARSQLEAFAGLLEVGGKPPAAGWVVSELRRIRDGLRTVEVLEGGRGQAKLGP
jgi:hypothetical protein